MKMEMYSMDITDLTAMANTVKEQVLGGLERDGLLKKSATEIAEEYAVVLSKPGWLGKLFAKLSSESVKDNKLNVNIVKLI